MKKRYIIFTATVQLLTVTTLCAQQKTSESFWDFNYNASCGMRPDQISCGKDKAVVLGYQFNSKEKPAYASMAVDKDKQIVLRLTNNGNDDISNHAKTKYAHYYIPLSTESGDEAPATLDIKFRLGGKVEKKAQFAASMVFSMNSEKKSYFFWITFAKDRIFYYKKNKPADFKYALDNTWHTARISVNLKNKTYSLHIDNKVKPIFTAQLFPTPPRAPKLQFGDGSSSVAGSVDLAYIRMTRKYPDK